MKEKFKPLLSWFKTQTQDIVRDGSYRVVFSFFYTSDNFCAIVIISDRLVTSPCAIVADVGGYTANLQRIMRASHKGEEENPMYEFAKRQKVLELNPRSPLVEGLLRRVEKLEGEDGERDLEAEDELKEVASILLDGALVRSGFDVPDSDE